MPLSFLDAMLLDRLGIKIVNSFLWLTLILLLLTYALVGWILSPQHIVWFVGTFMAILAIAIASTSDPWLEGTLGYAPQILLVVLTVSILVSLAATSSIFLTLIFIPFIATILAYQEVRFSSFRKLKTFWLLLAIALLGLGIGELIDILVIPSVRY